MKKEIKFEFQGTVYDLGIERNGDNLIVENGEKKYTVTLLESIAASRAVSAPASTKTVNAVQKTAIHQTAVPEGDGAEKASITGLIKEIIISKGAVVNNGDLLLIMEAMKMDIEVYAGKSGVISDIHVSAGMNVTAGQALVKIA